MADPTPPDQTVPATAMDAADEAFAKAWMNGADYADALRLAMEAAAPILVAAGRAQAATDIRAYADKIQRESWTPSTGVALAAVADQCAKIAEESQ